MSRKKSNSPASELRALSRQKRTLLDAFMPQSDADDRSTAIVLGAGLEAEIEDELKRRMVDLEVADIEGLFGEGSPLGDFAAKIKIGFAFGVFGPRTRNDLNLIRQIRNAFAHARRPITFTTPEIAKTCSRLETPDRFPNEFPLIAPHASEMRRRFELSAHMLSLSLTFRDMPIAIEEFVLHPLD